MFPAGKRTPSAGDWIFPFPPAYQCRVGSGVEVSIPWEIKLRNSLAIVKKTPKISRRYLIGSTSTRRFSTMSENTLHVPFIIAVSYLQYYVDYCPLSIFLSLGIGLYFHELLSGWRVHCRVPFCILRIGQFLGLPVSAVNYLGKTHYPGNRPEAPRATLLPWPMPLRDG